VLNRKSPIASRQAAFTLVELLIVIGIIAVLIGILLPAVGKVRIASQKVATQNTINRLVQGCEAYFADFNAYPGPFSDQLQVSPAIVPFVANQPIYLDQPAAAAADRLRYKDATGNAVAFQGAPTSSENLFLGLCGGLRLGPIGGVRTFYYDPEIAKQGKGPVSLSGNTFKKAQSYLELTNGDIVVNEDQRNPLVTDTAVPNGYYWPPAPAGPMYGTNFYGDSQIFEFMDRFAKSRPILYMRAQRGVNRTNVAATGAGCVSGFIYDPSTAQTKLETTDWQYRPDQIQFTYANIGLDRDKVTQLAGKIWVADPIDYPDAKEGAVIKFKMGNDRYFVNEQHSTGDPRTMGATANLVPQHKDGFILISAGADGLYGTADDIRN
jgi:prepilin-type N-terminal cleavage/methylation domain-containing protein